MSSSYMFIVIITSATLLQVRLALSISPLDQGFLRKSFIQGQLFQPSPDGTISFDTIGELSERQSGCVTGYFQCSSVANLCCPDGDDYCYSNGCCASQPLVGLVPCPSSSYCYVPPDEYCCSEGTGSVCEVGYTCCGPKCCNAYNYCGSDEICTVCDETTVTQTFTTTTLSTVLSTTTVTEFEEPEEASDFSCFPMTITNSENATLEIDTDCALSYSPPPSTSSSTSHTAAPAARALWERQSSGSGEGTCSSYVTTTELVTVSTIALTTVTVKEVVTTTQSSDEFSCPTLAVTNSAGAVLSLDASCDLAFEPASTTSSSSRVSASTTSRSDAAARTAQCSGGILLRWISALGVVTVFMLIL